MLMYILQVFLAFFIASMVVSMFKNKKQKGQQMADLQEKLAAYETITEEQILNATDDEAIEAVTYHMLDKVDSDYKAAMDEYNEEEKQFFTMYQLQAVCESPRNSVNDFFVSAKELVKYVPIMFDELGMPEGSAIFNEARALYLKFEEEYKRDIDEVVEELYNEEEEEAVEEKNFYDYTRELKEIFKSETYKTALAKYVKDHAERFVG